MNFRDGLKEFVGVVDRHGQHVCNAFASIPDLKRFAVESLSMARLTGDVDVGQEIHFHGSHAGTLARLASSPWDVEREPTFFVASDFGLWKQGELRSNQVHQAGVGGGIGPWRPSDGTLVNGNALVDVLQSGDRLVWKWDPNVVVQMVEQRGEQGLVDE